jgi:hypothetical protein
VKRPSSRPPKPIGPEPLPIDDAAVVRRAEVVQEHARVDDRLAARPADPVEQLGHRLGQDDVGAKRSQAACNGTPARGGGVDRDDDLARTDAPPRRLDDVG